jgi:hypothetical protein
MAIATPLTYPSSVFEKTRCEVVQKALYTALGFDEGDFELYERTVIFDNMHARIATLKTAIAAGGPHQDGRPTCLLYEGTGEFDDDVDEDFWNALMPGLKRLPNAVLIDLSHVLQFRYWPGLAETLGKGDICSIIIMHVYYMKTDPQIQRFKAEYLISPQEQEPADPPEEP